MLIRQGDAGDCFYLIQSGSVRVERDGQELARLGPGDYFGEMAVLDQEPRSATLTASEDCELLKLDQEDFYELLHEHPELSQSIIRTLARRVRGLLENG